MTVIAVFNGAAKSGKTLPVCHLAWMYADRGLNVAADLDPQANLPSMFLPEDRPEELWPDGDHTQTMLRAVTPILRDRGDIAEPHVGSIARPETCRRRLGARAIRSQALAGVAGSPCVLT